MLDRALVRDVFLEAAACPEDDRAELLERLCTGDAALRAEVESLLHAATRRPHFLGSPTAGAGEAAAEAAGARIGPYRLLHEIGQGGFGSVYLAEQEEPVRRRVALKVIKLGMDTKAVIARFDAERQALAIMDHEHIARVFDAGATESGRPYFVMELVNGDPITIYCDRQNLSISQRLEVFVQVCHAVQHAHSKGVIHRDLKPGNVLVTTQDGRPHAKVIDFGIAKATEHRLTEKSFFTDLRQFIGTPEYMSPEQADASLNIDTRTDVYSLGVLLYELLTGATPFDSTALRAAAYGEIQRIIREVEPPKPSTRVSTLGEAIVSVASQRRTEPGRLSPLLRGDLDWIVMRCLEKDRGRRYSTSDALAADLEAFLQGLPVSAVPPSALYRARKFAARNRGLVLGAGAVVTALVLGVIGTTLGLVAANAARAESQANAERAEQEARRAGQAEAQALRAKDQAEYDAYTANIESAYSALQFNDTTRLRTRLDACPPQRRNWEWRYLNAAGDGSTMVLTHPKPAVVSISLSRDGSRLLSSCNDGTARLWNPATGDLLAAWSDPKRFRGKVGFSPDGALVLAAAMDGRIAVWDSLTFAEVASLTGHTAAITFAAFAGDARVVSASDDGTVRLWDARSGAELRRMTHDGPIHRAALDPSATRLATASRDKTVRIWRLDGEAEPLVLRGHAESVVHVQWSADGSKVVSASYDGTARVWNALTGAEVSRFSHGARVLLATFSPDGARVVSGPTGGPPCVWDARTGQELLRLEGHSNTVLGVSFSKDGRRILTNARDNTVRLWDAQSGEEWSCLRGHVESPWVAEFTPSGEQIVTCGDTTVRLWPSNQDSAHSLIPSPLADSRMMSLAPDEQHVLETGDDRVQYIDLKSGRQTALFEHADPSGAGAISPDGAMILIAFPDHTVHRWDLTRNAEAPALTGHRGWVHGIGHDADGRRIATASEDGTARVWDATTGRELLVLRGHDDAVQSAEFDSAGKRIVTAGRDKTVRIWDAESGAELHTLRGHDGSVLHACFSADGSRILSTSTEFTAHVWNAATGERQLTLRGHEHVVFDGAFSPDGSRIVTCSMDGTLRLWDADNGRQILSMRGRSGGMTTARFTADGTRLFFCDTEGRARMLDSIPARERLADLPARR